MKEKKAAEEQLQGEEKVYCLCQRTFYVLPLFLWAATNGLKSSDPSYVYLDTQFHDCDEKRS